MMKRKHTEPPTTLAFEGMDGVQKHQEILECREAANKSKEASNSDDNSKSSSKSSRIYGWHRKGIFATLIVAIGTCASAAVFAFGLVAEEHRQEVLFEQRASDLANSIETVWNAYEIFGLWIKESCRSADSPVSSNTNQTTTLAQQLGICERERFHELYQHVESVGFEFQSAQLLVNITHPQRAPVEEDAREFYNENYPEYEYPGIQGFTADPNSGKLVIVDQQEDPFYVIVHYVEPFIGNQVVVDKNAYSRGGSRRAMLKALDTYKPVLTDPFQLIQEADKNAYGVILMHPGVPVASDMGQPPKSLSQMVLRAPALIAKAAELASVSLSVSLYDAPNPDDEPGFFGGANIHVDQTGHGKKDVSVSPIATVMDLPTLKASSRRYEERKLSIADRHWTVAVTSLEGTFQPRNGFVLLGGSILFAASIGIAVWFCTFMKRLEQLDRLKRESEQEKAALLLETTRRQTLAERQLNDFIAHEVRNPLSSAMAALSFVTTSGDFSPDTEKNKMVKDDLNTIEASLAFINELLRTMLDMHRAASRQMKLKPTYIDVLRDVLQPVASVLYLRRSKVHVEIDCPENLVVLSDGLRLKQVMLNLAQNATKYVEEGYIRMRACVCDGMVQICVEDSGPGIPLDKRDKLFQKFQDSLDLLNQGTGIGLCLCKHLSDLMGGSIYLDETFDSGVDGCPGTRFVFDLQVPPANENGDNGLFHPNGDHPPPPFVNFRDTAESTASMNTSSYNEESLSNSSPQTPEEIPEELSVLFVDDDMIIRKMFIRTLKKVAPKWNIQEASNGETALTLVEKSRVDDVDLEEGISHSGGVRRGAFDLIFMDQYMASVEKQLLGTETVRALRAKGVDSLICGLSANDKADDFADAGADAFWFKPFPCQPDALKAELLRLIQSAQMRPQVYT